METHPSAQPGIPWVFHHSAAGLSTWVWETDHFVVTIVKNSLGGRDTFQYTVQARSNGLEWVIDDGLRDTYASAAQDAVSFALKSYPDSGLREYAPEIAATYVLYGGRSVCLNDLHGVQVCIMFMDSDGQHAVKGLLVTGGHDLVLRTHAGVWSVRPANVVSVVAT